MLRTIKEAHFLSFGNSKRLLEDLTTKDYGDLNKEELQLFLMNVRVSVRRIKTVFDEVRYWNVGWFVKIYISILVCVSWMLKCTFVIALCLFIRLSVFLSVKFSLLSTSPDQWVSWCLCTWWDHDLRSRFSMWMYGDNV